jgi:nucleoid-associated protein YgaU
VDGDRIGRKVGIGRRREVFGAISRERRFWQDAAMSPVRLCCSLALSCVVTACAESKAGARTSDGVLVLEVGGDQSSLREALHAAGVAFDARPRLPDAEPVRTEPLSDSPPPDPTTAPVPQPTPPAPPAETWFTVEMKSGDSLIQIAKKHLGNGNRFRDILKWNGWSEDDALTLRPGTKVKLRREASPNGRR